MNKVIKYAVAGAVALSLTASSYAVITVNWGSGDATPFDDSSSTALPVGDLIEVGVATSPGSASASLNGSQNLTAIGFTAFGTGAIGDGSFPAGFAGVTSTGNGGATFSHAQIVVVAFNASSAGAASQMGIWSVEDRKSVV